jgi:hypothetical protein
VSPDLFRHAVLPVVVISLMLHGDELGHAQDTGVPELVSRASKYVEEFARQLSAVVCEERQTQRVINSDGTTRQTRELVSDMLLVKTGADST